MQFRNNRDAPRYPLHPSSEPLGMTISDWFVITSGCALCLSIMNIAPFLAWIGVIPVGLTFAVLVRQTKYRRSIDPSEYPILFVTALAFALAAPNVDTTLNWLSLLIYGQPLESWTLWSRVLAGLALILAAILIMPMSRLPSSAAKSVLATLALVIILWVPMSVFPVEFDPIWFVTIDVPLTLRDVFLMEFRDAIHRTPMLICWVYLTAISLRSLRVRSRPWTSFAGTFLALLLLLALVVMDAIVRERRSLAYIVASKTNMVFYRLTNYLEADTVLATFSVRSVGISFQRYAKYRLMHINTTNKFSIRVFVARDDGPSGAWGHAQSESFVINLILRNGLNGSL